MEVAVGDVGSHGVVSIVDTQKNVEKNGIIVLNDTTTKNEIDGESGVDENHDDDDPAQSSAASCIRISMMKPQEEQQQDNESLFSSPVVVGSSSFSPVFTHQLFDDEHIPGYRPLHQNQQHRYVSNNNNNENTNDNASDFVGTVVTPINTNKNKNRHYPHSSYRYHKNSTTTPELDIHIQLAPSCQFCTVQIHVQNPLDESCNDNNHKKRSVTDTSVHETFTATSTTNNSNDTNQFEEFITNEMKCCKRFKVTSSGRNIQRSRGFNRSSKRVEEEEESDGDNESVELGSEDSDDDEEDEESSEEENMDDITTSSDIPNNKENRLLHDSNHDTKTLDDNPRVVTMSVQQIRKQLALALPPIIETTTSDHTFDHMMYLSEPIGTFIHEYSRSKQLSNESRQEKNILLEPSSSSEHSFVITLANGTDCYDYHNRVQKLALFYIESADHVNVQDCKEGGYWKVLYIFQKHTTTRTTTTICNGDVDQPNANSNVESVPSLTPPIKTTTEQPTETKFSFIGYMTLYHFHNPFRKPIPGCIVRICQALILPPYQRYGHGREVLHTLFRINDNSSFMNSKSKNQSHDDDDDTTIIRKNYEQKNIPEMVVEINVEDPAPGFTALRDRVDYERFLKSGSNWFHLQNDNDSYYNNNNTKNGLEKEDHQNKGALDELTFEPISDKQLLGISKITLLPKRQIQLVYELYKLHQVQQKLLLLSQQSNVEKESLEKKYRLMVKQRLNIQEKETLKSSCYTKQDMKEMLTKWYDEIYQHYDTILNRVHLGAERERERETKR